MFLKDRGDPANDFEQPAEKTVDDTTKALRAFNRAFCASVPEKGRSGHYKAEDGDRFDGSTYGDADGSYRVVGSDWIFKFKAGVFVEATMARPPKFGGKNVTAVSAD